MHTCPRCGMDCDCSGDWDDVSVMSDTWVWKNCQCECEHFQREDDYDGDDDDYYDDDDNDEPEYYQCLGCQWSGTEDPGTHCPRCTGATIEGVY